MRYLAAVDLSDASLLALDTLRTLAGKEPGGVTLLHVVDLDLYTAGGSVPGIMEFAEERLRTESVRLADCGLSVENIRVEQGDSAQTILRVAAEESADLIVMTNLGKGARTGRLFGSTAERVASSGSVPVLVERVGLTESDVEGEDASCCRLIEGSSFERVLSAVDLDHDPEDVLGFVSALPGLDSARVIYVVRRSDEVEPARTRLEALVSALPPDVGVESEVLVGAPAESIIEDAADWGATTIALSPCGHGALYRAVWGSVAREVALHAEGSVLFVPAAPQG